MKIESILNNSAVIAFDENGQEVVLIGKGISYGRHIKDEVDTSKIEKEFGMYSSSTQKLVEVIKSVPERFFEAANIIIRHTEKILNKKLDDSIYITVPDHLYSAYQRYNDGIHLVFGFLDDVKLLYPEEFDAALWALDYINTVLETEMPEDEAGFLSIHIISASSQFDNLSTAKEIMRVVREINKIVLDEFPSINVDGINYSRFMAHLKYLALRYLKKSQLKDDMVISFKKNFAHEKQVKKCIESINKLLNTKFNEELTDDERNYLMLHICRLLGDSN